MNKRNRTYTQEFKLKALELLKNSGKSAAQLERELGITKGLLKWRDRCQVRRDQGEVSLAPICAWAAARLNAIRWMGQIRV